MDVCLFKKLLLRFDDGHFRKSLKAKNYIYFYLQNPQIQFNEKV